MKRKKRNPEKFDPVELFTAIGRDRGYTITADSDVDDFVERVGRSLKSSQTNPTLLHGKRTEALFAHVAGALGRCRLIKQEDSGSVFIDGQDIEIPDYRLILNDGSIYLVEVKNFHSYDFRTEFTLRRDYLEKLAAYAALNGVPFRVALYFSNPNVWVLLPKEAFTLRGGKYRIDFVQALARNDMALLGDRTIATLPDLRIEFWGDPTECSAPGPDGTAPFTIRRIRVFCQDQEITDDPGKNIAFYLTRLGRWEEKEDAAVIEEGKLVGLRFIFGPREPAEDQEFQIVGTLSAMVSRAYQEMTMRESDVVSIDVKHDPDIFSLSIPEGYRGSLPLWQFILQPNYDLQAGM
ncbi:MAG: hypothetical protein EOR73_31985 [Mesorhizobium sp.]|nr:MAG: hypothetical protein EOR73_31985 [Mesorhizobium sp.]